MRLSGCQRTTPWMAGGPRAVSVLVTDTNAALDEQQSPCAALHGLDEECTSNGSGTHTQKQAHYRHHMATRFNSAQWQLQDRPCGSTNYAWCFSCQRADPEDCRFTNRMLRSVKGNACRRVTLHDIGPLSAEQHVQMGIADYSRNTCSTRATTGDDLAIAAYIAQCAKPVCGQIATEEFCALRHVANGAAVYFSYSLNSKEVCDVCHFSILAMHMTCVSCGIEVCLHCFNELQQGAKDKSAHGRRLASTARRVWLKLKCTSMVPHRPADFHLATFTSVCSVFLTLLKSLINACNKYSIQNSIPCNGNHARRGAIQDKCYCPMKSDGDIVHVGELCVIENQLAWDAYARFVAHMAVQKPVLVKNVNKHPNYRADLWNLSAFKRLFSNATQRVNVLDSQTFKVALNGRKKYSVADLWTAFENEHTPGQPHVKIKDFPEFARFGEVAPAQFANLYEILPFVEYTRISTNKDYSEGRLNLLNIVSGSSDAPDSGPKVYVCCGLCSSPELASTPLHLDVSNAVNLLAVVQPPRDVPLSRIAAALEQRLIAEGVSESERARVLEKPEKAGALWKIFSSDDNAKLRAAIAEWRSMQGARPIQTDAIHRQDVVVTPLMSRFFSERDIRCSTFVQCEGDVVFVPTGAAHQVANLQSCIKVAEDFLAPEGLKYVRRIDEELRCYKHKEDLLEVDKVLYQAFSWCVSALCGDTEP